MSGTGTWADSAVTDPTAKGSVVALLKGLLTQSNINVGLNSSYTYTTSADMTSVADITAAPTAGEKLVITDILVSSDTATLISFKEETSGTVIGAIRLAADTVMQITPRSKWKLATADKKLQGQAADAGNVYFTVFYYSEA